MSKVTCFCRPLSDFARYANVQFKSGAWDDVVDWAAVVVSFLLALMLIGAAVVVGAVLIGALLGIFTDINASG